MSLENLIFKAGEETEQPPEPEGGIPRQWLPSFIRFPLKLLCLPFIAIDLAMQKVARILIPPPFKIAGKCTRRGNCCHYIMIRKPKGPFAWAYLLWNTQVNGFYLRSKEDYEYENHKVLIMGCRHLRKDGSCGSYRTRPMVCRKWPVIEHFGFPRILKGCGFKAVPRKPKPDQSNNICEK